MVYIDGNLNIVGVKLNSVVTNVLHCIFCFVLGVRVDGMNGYTFCSYLIVTLLYRLYKFLIHICYLIVFQVDPQDVVMVCASVLLD